MKILKNLLFLLLFAVGIVLTPVRADAAITLVSSGSDQAVSNVDVVLNSTGATLGVAVCSGDGSSDGGQTVTDDQGNTWVKIAFVPSAGQHVCMWYSSLTTTNASHTVTYNGAFASLIVKFYSATDTVSVLDGSATTNSGGSLGTIQPGSITPSANGGLLVTGMTVTSGIGLDSVDSGFTNLIDLAETPGIGYAAGAADLIQSTAGAVNPTWTGTDWLGTKSAAVIMQAFKAASAPASSTPPSLTTLGAGG